MFGSHGVQTTPNTRLLSASDRAPITFPSKLRRWRSSISELSPPGLRNVSKLFCTFMTYPTGLLASDVFHLLETCRISFMRSKRASDATFNDSDVSWPHFDMRLQHPRHRLLWCFFFGESSFTSYYPPQPSQEYLRGWIIMIRLPRRAGPPSTSHSLALSGVSERVDHHDLFAVGSLQVYQ